MRLAAAALLALLATPGVRADPIDLGEAATFGILSTTLTANIGVTSVMGDAGYTTLSGSGTLVVGGTTYTPSPAQAIADQATALGVLNALTCSYAFATGDIDLATDTSHGPAGVFTPGVYCVDGIMDLGGGATLTLTGRGEYVFRSTGAFNTSASSRVVLLGGAESFDVYWVPAGAVTLGAASLFQGTVITDAAITAGGRRPGPAGPWPRSIRSPSPPPACRCPPSCPS